MGSFLEIHIFHGYYRKINTIYVVFLLLYHFMHSHLIILFLQIIYAQSQLEYYLEHTVEMSLTQPVLIDKYIIGKEVEVDAICDGEDVFVPGIMEHIERTGVHSGDSMSVYPSYSISSSVKDTILKYTKALGLSIGIVGLFNIQFIVDHNENVYVIEVNPRSSRTVPFISKVTQVALANIATKVILGEKLKNLGYTQYLEEPKNRYYVKAPTFSFAKIRGVDAILGPEMKSTGEAIGYDETLPKAVYKALQATGMKISNYGTVFLTFSDQDKAEGLMIAKRFFDLGFNLVATRGTSDYLKAHGLKVKALSKLSEGSNEIIEWIQSGHLKYIVNTMTNGDQDKRSDGFMIRRMSVERHLPVFTSLDTVKVVLDVLDEITIKVGVINE